jgi:hypothetical protein
MTKEEIKKIICEMYWDLNKDYKLIDDFANISYDIGMMIAYCKTLGKEQLADRLTNKFLGNW